MKIACVSDLHLRGKGIIEKEQHEYFDFFLEHIKKEGVNHLIICGDIVRTKGNPINEYHFNGLISRLIKYGYYNYNKCTLIPGNHDYNHWGFRGKTVHNKSKIYKIMRVLNYKERPNNYKNVFSKYIGKFSIIGVNTVNIEEGDEEGMITEEQLTNIRKLIENSKKNNVKYIIIAMHHGPSDIMDYEDELYEIFEDEKANYVVFGHDHALYKYKKKKVEYYCVGESIDINKYLLIKTERQGNVKAMLRNYS